jgi:hypothetical protein
VHGLVGLDDVQRVAVGVAVHGDGADPVLGACTKHTQRDLSAVGDEDLAKRRCS